MDGRVGAVSFRRTAGSLKRPAAAERSSPACAATPSPDPLVHLLPPPRPHLQAQLQLPLRRRGIQRQGPQRCRQGGGKGSRLLSEAGRHQHTPYQLICTSRPCKVPRPPTTAAQLHSPVSTAGVTSAAQACCCRKSASASWHSCIIIWDEMKQITAGKCRGTNDSAAASAEPSWAWEAAIATLASPPPAPTTSTCAR